MTLFTQLRIKEENVGYSSCWYTPATLVKAIRDTLGGQIDLDPCSDHKANQVIQAYQYYSGMGVEGGLAKAWGNVNKPNAVYCNPPGLKDRDDDDAPKYRDRPHKFWNKLLEEVSAGRVSHGIFMIFNINQLCTMQSLDANPLHYPTCILRRRIKFLEQKDPNSFELFPATSPANHSALVYVPGIIDSTEEFIDNFLPLGEVVGTLY